jgi:hypothetical protein
LLAELNEAIFYFVAMNLFRMFHISSAMLRGTGSLTQF